ncbi:DNA-3-methyladenine glycosylase family protein [Neptuniibacter halophilus]|uniref:DNA-3-methyladenine glycosylase family protein n=1 Tax=Neptuniibacter halophilus TaxID=651666 RepID=UPI0025747571|nr:DNA-3-methyladenine glycosylase 2 family protein [Neptuniibacter halophilus]
MDQQTIASGIDYLCQVDPDLQQAVALLGPPAPRLRPAGFETFLSTIVSQQLSTEVARAIMTRVRALLPDLTPQALLQLDREALRGAGLSYRKVEYAQGLAAAIQSGDFLPDQLPALSDQAAIDAITRLRGFGRWSAEIYLMFSLRREDIFPADDLALQVALGRLKGLEQRPRPALARELTAHWAPWRSVGSLFLWHYYRGAPN